MRHRFHSICPYFAMFPESFAADWITKLTKPNDIVLDPFSGRGTAPFQALLMDRVGVGADINPVAACLNIAKLKAPTFETVHRRLLELESGYKPRVWHPRVRQLNDFFRMAYHTEVLAALLYLRATLQWKERRSDSFISALVLGALHGETSSPRYLSNQMPRTISTKPDYSVRFWTDRGLMPPERDVFEVLRSAAKFRYVSPLPRLKGWAYYGDMRELPRRWRGTKPSLIVTSPPYGHVTSYEEDQWLRLWFLGGPQRPRKGFITKDDQRSDPVMYWSFIGDFWRVVSQLLLPRGHVVVRIGSTQTRAENLARQLVGSFAFSPRRIRHISTEFSEIRRRQTDAFRPGAKGCITEVDVHGIMD